MLLRDWIDYKEEYAVYLTDAAQKEVFSLIDRLRLCVDALEAYDPPHSCPHEMDWHPSDTGEKCVAPCPRALRRAALAGVEG